MKEAPAENWEDAADAQNELPANDKKQTDQATGQPLRTRANTDIYIPPKEALTVRPFIYVLSRTNTFSPTSVKSSDHYTLQGYTNILFPHYRKYKY